MTEQKAGTPQSQPDTKGNERNIHLEAVARNGIVKIESDVNGPDRLDNGSGPHRFTFHLRDKTFPSMGVRFCTVEEGLLDVDESEDCPPATGIHTDQVDPQSVMSTAKMAAFTDKNSGEPRTLSYALNFRCDDPSQQPKFDPIIINGGSSS